MAGKVGSEMEAHEQEVKGITIKTSQNLTYALIPAQTFALFVLNRKVHESIVTQLPDDWHLATFLQIILIKL